MQTKNVLDCMNVALESAGEAAISSSDIGRLMQVAFGSANKVHRKKSEFKEADRTCIVALEIRPTIPPSVLICHQQLN